MKRLLYLMMLPLMILLFQSEARASHYMGGEITWTCTPQGNFRFVMKVYRECAGINYPATATLQTNATGFSSIQMSRISITDMSPQCSCPGGPNITCANTSVSNTGGVEEHIYTSDASYPNGVPLTGVPPPTGWYFGYTSCCRNPCTNIPNSSSLSWYLRAWMFPYNNTPVNTCFDNSPKFDERPSTVICTGYPYQYNHVASDVELDSLVYAWDQPLNNNISSPIVAWNPGYSWNSPLPGPLQNPNNVAATINANTGVISFTSYTNGAFVTVTKVTAFKCGIKVAEIFREMQVVLLSCGTNNPPNVTPPFPNSVGQYTLYTDTVYAGQNVTFSISATDFEYCPGATPPVAQTLKLFAVGAQFGAPINPTGCLNPPCAVLTPSPTFTVPLTGTFGVQTSFNWQTGCQHLATNIGCGATSNTYNFLFKTMDNFCPAPGIRYATVTIVVLTKPTLPSPPIHCLAVLPNGDVELTWTEVKDTMNTFDSYHIWASNSMAGPFVAVDSVFNISTTTTTHFGAGANTNPMYYYVTVRSGCNGQEMADPTDTASTIYLDVVNPGAAFGVANLTWNATHTPLLPSSSGIYEVWREYPAGNWQLIATTPNTAYVDTITVCNQFINYRIEILDTLINDSTGIIYCRSISNIDGDQFEDVTPPFTPTIYTVTVDNTSQQSILTWNVNSSEDVIGYVVYTYNSGVYTPQETLWSRSDTMHVDITSNPCQGYVTYTVQAFDSCGNYSQMSQQHNTIYTEVKQTDCIEENVLTWNPYINMAPSLGGYDIFLSVNGGAPAHLANLGAGVTTYTHSNLDMGSQYCYLIQAYDVNLEKTSESCVVCNVISMPNQPDYLYIKTATVVNNDFVKVVLYTDPNVYVTEYRLERSDDGVAYSQIAILPMSTLAEIEYNDYGAVFQNRSYYYRAIVVDSCGYIADTSNIARTILLGISTSQQQTSNQLVWNDYEGFDGAPTSYNIWRRVDGVLDPLPISVYPPASGNHVDDVGALPKSSGMFTYYVEALEGAGNQYGLQATSLSNEVQALMEPKLFIPTAFTPQGVISQNVTFKPIGVFVPGGNYEFTIFNRLGQMLFTTTDRDQGWDGTFKGEFVPEGVYVYVVKFISATKKEYERRGTVTVLR
ncbi:MAG: gliding motility-associated C-terminal domain-containing protein [Bacteroidales bacterium]